MPDKQINFNPTIAQAIIHLVKLAGVKLEDEHTVSWTYKEYTYIEHDDGTVQFNQLRSGDTILYTE